MLELRNRVPAPLVIADGGRQAIAIMKRGSIYPSDLLWLNPLGRLATGKGLSLQDLENAVWGMAAVRYHMNPTTVTIGAVTPRGVVAYVDGQQLQLPKAQDPAVFLPIWGERTAGGFYKAHDAGVNAMLAHRFNEAEAAWQRTAKSIPFWWDGHSKEMAGKVTAFNVALCAHLSTAGLPVLSTTWTGDSLHQTWPLWLLLLPLGTVSLMVWLMTQAIDAIKNITLSPTLLIVGLAICVGLWAVSHGSSTPKDLNAYTDGRS